MPTFEIPFLAGIIFLVIGTVFYFLPPKKINHFYGYRTLTSMKSQERWDFAQKYSAIKMIQGSIFLLSVSALIMLIPLSIKQKFYIGMGAFVTHVIAIVFFTEIAIKKQFPKS